MRAVSCGVVRRQLTAYHDGELSVSDQIAVESHFRTCPACEAEARELDALGGLLRQQAQASMGLGEPFSALPSIVVSRMKAEQEQSLEVQTGRLFDDLHLVWAALGATGATVVCMMLVFGIFYYATSLRPDSLGGLLMALSVQAGSNENPVAPDATTRMPSAMNDAFPAAAIPDQDEAVLALSAVVTREGSVASVELHGGLGPKASAAEREAILALMDSISKARFQEPANRRGYPVALTAVWLHTQLTVRGTTPREEPRTPRAIISISEEFRLATALAA